ncbi:DUF3024 domain-containing protein [Vibrio sp. SCSIO 43137]|uniref:DUF3024 domain-containing protein n=1 Tax=Vibrio sp. SCSIO 43137 TaxID=3021011 RepID=UPI002307F07A|nr:DUF3024 domain-containing protein [Vibrio sp. SCSIO 43137]WCE31507.1 DUF3024 domain-containing protein [Vibrio sp. SCSIO 43137]
MYKSELDQFRLEKSVRGMCSNRNRGIPAELGKVQYEMYDNGVLFTKLCFLLDSAHINYECPVAKMEFNPQRNEWLLFVAECEENSEELLNWLPYPYLASSNDFKVLLNELEHDPKQLFW